VFCDFCGDDPAHAQPASFVDVGAERPDRAIEVGIQPMPQRRKQLEQRHTYTVLVGAAVGHVLNEAFTPVR
jgi:hypothetical protein